MLAENYPYFSATQEMRKLYMQGVIGDVKYAEGEHVRTVPVEASMRLSPGLGHWRNHCPSTYYSSHALAPLMYMTDTMPVRVSAFSMTDPDQEKTKVKVGDPAAVIVCRMDNGAVFQLVNGNMAGQRVYFKLHGFKGMMETTGAIANSGIRIVRNEWELGPDEYEETAYQTKFPSHASSAKRAGHGGGDFWTRYHFAEAVRSNKQPYLDVYKGVAMAAVAILAWKSALQDGVPLEVPDFSKEEVRKLHEHDDWSPWPEDRGPGQPWPSVRGQIIPSEAAISHASRVWSQSGYSFNR
jgi:predicted dehydrogenase